MGKFEEIKGVITVRFVPVDVFVYFLLKDEEVVYVGKTTHGITRPFQHKDKEYDTIKILPCTEESLSALEDTYILKYKPKYNLIIGNSMVYSLSKVRKLLRSELSTTNITLHTIKKVIKECKIPVVIYQGRNYILRDKYITILEYLQKKRCNK